MRSTMLNEERVKQLYKVALYEKREEKVHKQIGKYYRGDYIGKEILKSIFTGTLAYLCIAVLMVIKNWQAVLNAINKLEFEENILPILMAYALFMSGYIALTYVVYKARYDNSRKNLDEYERELRVLHQMYEREEKLK